MSVVIKVNLILVPLHLLAVVNADEILNLIALVLSIFPVGLAVHVTKLPPQLIVPLLLQKVEKTANNGNNGDAKDD